MVSVKAAALLRGLYKRETRITAENYCTTDDTDVPKTR